MNARERRPAKSVWQMRASGGSEAPKQRLTGVTGQSYRLVPPLLYRRGSWPNRSARERLRSLAEHSAATSGRAASRVGSALSGRPFRSMSVAVRKTAVGLPAHEAVAPRTRAWCMPSITQGEPIRVLSTLTRCAAAQRSTESLALRGPRRRPPSRNPRRQSPIDRLRGRAPCFPVDCCHQRPVAVTVG